MPVRLVRRHDRLMVTISISPEAYAAIGATLQKDRGPMLDRTARAAISSHSIELCSTGFARCAGPGESYSDVILRIAGRDGASN